MIDKTQPYFEKFGTLRIDLSTVVYYRAYYSQNSSRPFIICFHTSNMRGAEESIKSTYLNDDKKDWEEAAKLLDDLFSIKKVTL